MKIVSSNFCRDLDHRDFNRRERQPADQKDLGDRLRRLTENGSSSSGPAAGGSSSSSGGARFGSHSGQSGHRGHGGRKLSLSKYAISR